MAEDGINKQNDPFLHPFLNAVGEAESSKKLAELLIRQIQPEISKTLRRKMHASLKTDDFNQNNQEALEIASEVKYLLIAKLGKLKTDQNGNSIQNLKNYVVSVTINAYQQYLRNKFPLRQQLKNKLRYLLNHHPKFSLWETEAGWLCGLQQWSAESGKVGLNELPVELAESIKRKQLHAPARIVELVRTIFEFAQGSIYFNDLVALVAQIQGIKDNAEVLLSSDFPEPADCAHSENRILTGMEQQELLKRVWSEIQELPVRHRLALILNLKDPHGNCLVHLFPLLRIASIRQIGEILEFSPERFAAIWHELPWDDIRIAEHLGLTRQQIINLRQSARTRLVRILKKI